MKTTVETDAVLFRQAKVYAAAHGHSLRSLLEEGLRARLAGRDPDEADRAEREEQARCAAIRDVVARTRADPLLDEGAVPEGIEWDENGLPR